MGTAHGAVVVTDVAEGRVVGAAPPGAHVRAERGDPGSRWRLLGSHDPRAAVTAIGTRRAIGSPSCSILLFRWVGVFS